MLFISINILLVAFLSSHEMWAIWLDTVPKFSKSDFHSVRERWEQWWGRWCEILPIVPQQIPKELQLCCSFTQGFPEGTLLSDLGWTLVKTNGQAPLTVPLVCVSGMWDSLNFQLCLIQTENVKSGSVKFQVIFLTGGLQMRHLFWELLLNDS